MSNRPDPNGVRHVAVVGGGTVGTGWAAYFLSRGLRVTVTDPVEGAEERLNAFIRTAWPSLRAIGGAETFDSNALGFTPDLAEAVAEADFIQENVPERIEAKQSVLAAIDRACRPEVVISSSTSGLAMTEMQRDCTHPGRCVTGHPFNPPHLIPLVEVVGGAKTDADAVDWAMAFYRAVGKKPIHLKRELTGHVANRLQAALYREAVYLVAEGAADVADVDAAIAYGPGLRWAIMGPHMTYHLGGGTGGMKSFLAHIGPPMESWWRDLGDAALTPEVCKMLIDGVDAEAQGKSLAELARIRDELLVTLVKELGASDRP